MANLLRGEGKLMEENQVLNQNEEVVDTQPQTQEKTFTQDELNNILEKRLERENRKWEAKFNALEESHKLSQMNDEQKQEYDYTKRLEELTTREQELENKINQYNKQQYKNTIEEQLKEAGLPLTMSDLLVDMEAEVVSAKIKDMKESLDIKINEQLKSRIQSSVSTPIKPQEEVKLLTLEQIKAMNTTEYLANKQLIEESLKALR